MSATRVLLEEKHRRAVKFGKFIESAPESEGCPLAEELQRATAYYRIAISNYLVDLAKRASNE